MDDSMDQELSDKKEPTTEKELDIRKTKLKQAGIQGSPKSDSPVPAVKPMVTPAKTPVEKAVQDIKAKRANPNKGDLDKRYEAVTKGLSKRY